MGGLTVLLVLIFGAVVGSFLNVVVYRYNTGFSPLGWPGQAGGRSRCLACGHRLAWFDLLPIASFLFLGGRCRYCRAAISWQYPLVEVLTGFLFLRIWNLGWPWPLSILAGTITGLLIVIAVYDWRHQIIPDGLVWSFAGLALLWRYLDFGAPGISPAVLTGGGLFLFFWLLWRVSQGRWMGLGDGKLALGIGLLLGPAAGLTAVTLGFWSGALVGLALLAGRRLWRRGKSFTIKSEIPFAPFLILGCFLSWLFGFNAIFWF